MRKRKQRTTPTCTFALHSTRGRLPLLTRNYIPRSPGMLMIGCVRASRAPAVSRRQPEATREVFSCTLSCEPIIVAQTSFENAQLCFFAQEMIGLCYDGGKNGLHRKIGVLQGNAVYIFNPFRTPVPFWGQGTQIPSNLSPIVPKTRLQF